MQIVESRGYPGSKEPPGVIPHSVIEDRLQAMPEPAIIMKRTNPQIVFFIV